MTKIKNSTPMRVRWARLRFSIIGPLLSAPPESGELRERIQELADRAWLHPTTNERIRFAFKTIERWYYLARDKDDPIVVLERKVPRHAGTHPRVSVLVAAELKSFRRDHPAWSYKLVFDNLKTISEKDDKLLPLPSYATVTRYMKGNGLEKRKRKSKGRREFEEKDDFQRRECRSFEFSHVHAMWHYDFHDAKRTVLFADGQWRKPTLFAVLDDYSRLCCHAQWYVEEETETVVHGLMQAMAKRGLPREILSDNGGAMVAAETTQGLMRLSIEPRTTLPAHPEQNGKQEHFWTQVEGRLMPQLEGEVHLTLELLNRATQAWVEREYHQAPHSELGKVTPLHRALSGPSLVRPCPSSQELKRRFKKEVTRTLRKSDCTCTVYGIRYEVPWVFRSVEHLRLRVARWDLSSVDFVDKNSGKHLATLLPLDKQKYADGVRPVVDGPAEEREKRPPAGIAPHLQKHMEEYAATGLPPAYLPYDNTQDRPDKSGNDEVNS